MAAVQTQPTASELEMHGSSWEVNYDGKWYPAEVAGTYTIEKENYIVLLFSDKQVATHTVSALLSPPTPYGAGAPGPRFHPSYDTV